MALVPRVVDAVDVPVIAAGGIADGRGVAAAFVLGASAVQIGTAYLLCPEALISPIHRRALTGGSIDDTVLTNVFTGRPARGRRNRLVDELGPMSADAPAFPTANNAVAPLRAAAEQAGSGDFSPLWSGQAGAPTSRRPCGSAHSRADGQRTRGARHVRVNSAASTGKGQSRSKRSRFMTLSHAATKSRTNFSFASSHA